MFELINHLRFSNIIAFSALALAIYQGYLARKHNRLSSLPHLSIRTNKLRDKEFSIILKSNGNGVAVLKNVFILIDGNKHNFSSTSLKKAVKYANEVIKDGINVASGFSDEMLMPGEEVVLIKSEFGPSMKISGDLLDEVSLKIKLIVEYQSVYNKKFVVTNF